MFSSPRSSRAFRPAPLVSRRLLMVLVVTLMATVAGCTGGSADATGPENPVDDQTTVLTRDDVRSAPTLSEGDGYRVVATPPATIDSRPTMFDAMISPSEVFGTLQSKQEALDGGGEVVVYDMSSKKTTRLDPLRPKTQVVGVSFSERYVVWSESSLGGVFAGPWEIKSLDQETGTVRTIAEATDVGPEDASLVDADGGVPRIFGDDAVFVASDRSRLPTTASAYTVPLDGSAAPSKIAKDVEGAFPSGDRIALVRDGRFSLLDPATDEVTDVEQARGASSCPPFAAQGVLVRCSAKVSPSRLVVTEPSGVVTRVELGPDSGAMSNGPTYLGASKDWVSFTYGDEAYVLDLRTKQLGRFAGAQFVTGDQSYGSTLRYARMASSPTGAEPVPFVSVAID